MSDDILKKVHEAIVSHVRARLRDGWSMGEIRAELIRECDESVSTEVLRVLMKEAPYA